MSPENVELVRRVYAALDDFYRSGEIAMDAIEETWHRDCALKPSGLLPESREMRGHEGVVQFTTAQGEAFERMWAARDEFIAAGDTVVVPFRFGGVARSTGIEVSFAVVHVWTVRGGKVARLDMYRTKEEALKAAGLT